MAVTFTDGGLKGVIRKIIPFIERHEASVSCVLGTFIFLYYLFRALFM